MTDRTKERAETAEEISQHLATERAEIELAALFTLRDAMVEPWKDETTRIRGEWAAGVLDYLKMTYHEAVRM